MGRRLENARSLYMEAIQDGDFVTAINKYSGDRYTQHSTPVRDGKEGFIQFFTDFVGRNPDREIRILRSFEDGQYVFLHVVQILNGGEYRYVTADIFDTDAHGRLIEHWDIIEELTDDSQVEGLAQIDDLDQTEANKNHVRRFVESVWAKGEKDKAGGYLAHDYLEHSPRLKGNDYALSDVDLEEMHLLVGSGNFVATLSEVRRDEAALAVIDVFRLEGGLIVEHWDVTEEILQTDQWVNSGKF